MALLNRNALKNQTPDVARSDSQSRWHRALFSVRTRLLLWYLFLAGCTAGISIGTANRIYCDAMIARAESAINRQMDQFQIYVQRKRAVGYSPFTPAALFDGFLSSYASTQNEYVITLLNGKLHHYRPDSSPPPLLQQQPSILREWSQVKQRTVKRLEVDGRRYQFIAEPFQIQGHAPGTVIVLYDSTTDFQEGQQASAKLLRNVLIFLAISFVLAWITAGRVLQPLRRVTQTAHSITESDMTQRILVQGKDEIAELATTFNEMLDRLQLAFDSQKEFLKDASHELRTPVTIIRGHLEMLHYRPERQEATIALLLDELERMGRLVNDLLLLAKTDHPDFLNPKPEELDWLTEELYLKARSFAQRNWRLESKGLSPITVDRQRLTQAVMNLVQNAVRHTQPTDTITLGSAVKDNHAYLWVCDTGEGIALEDQKRIFDRFARVTQNRQLEGHGLGLSIVQAIVQSHGGRVELKSYPGQGATFTIVLPLDPQQLLMNRILIVEDNPRISSFLETGLQANGFTTLVVDTAKQAIQLAHSDDFDLLILDLGLPDQDGINVLATVRGQGEPLPIIVLTARDGLDDTIAGLEGGADDYITKPFRFEELLARMRVQLRNRQMPRTKEETQLRMGNITLDLLSRQVWVGERSVELSAREFLLVEVLIRHPMQVMTREQLLDRIWGYDYDPGTNIVNVYIGHLRRKLGEDYIETIRGVGYRLRSNGH